MPPIADMQLQSEPIKDFRKQVTIHDLWCLCESGNSLLFAELCKPSGEPNNLTDGAQDVISLFGVLT